MSKKRVEGHSCKVGTFGMFGTVPYPRNGGWLFGTNEVHICAENGMGLIQLQQASIRFFRRGVRKYILY